jgi:AMMECR1 domain-containing protein
MASDPPQRRVRSLHTRRRFARLHRLDPSVAPLCRAVCRTINAAFRDPRFYPIEREDLARIHIEISVMSPIEVVSDVDSVVVGRWLDHYARQPRGPASPQVATE